MNQALILWPMFAMVALVFAVWVTMYRSRIGEIRRSRLNPQQLANNVDTQRLMAQVAGPSDNFSNLFEVPVLFYAAVLTAYVTQNVDAIIVVLAWSFVIGRIVHSGIHITYNKVLHRFTAYVVSSGFLWLMWLWLALRLAFPSF